VTRDADKAKAAEIWERFPKFILGSCDVPVGLYLALGTTADLAAKLPAAIGEANTFRVIFFILTFFSIGVLSNFRKLWQEASASWPRSILEPVRLRDLGGLLISWLFFSGVKPPLVS